MRFAASIRSEYHEIRSGSHSKPPSSAKCKHRSKAFIWSKCCYILMKCMKRFALQISISTVGACQHCKISNQVRVIIYYDFADVRLHIITTSSKKHETSPPQNPHWQPNVVYSPFLFTRGCRQLNLSLGCRLHQWYKPTIAISYRKNTKNFLQAHLMSYKIQVHSICWGPT